MATGERCPFEFVLSLLSLPALLTAASLFPEPVSPVPLVLVASSVPTSEFQAHASSIPHKDLFLLYCDKIRKGGSGGVELKSVLG